nr:acyltransferase [Ochrobactrum vermis]
MFAVNFFYVISGFLMTLVLQEAYQFDGKRFATNRFLRLYPSYAVIACCALIVFAAYPSYPIFHPSWNGQADFWSWMGNMFIVPWAFLSDPTVHVTPFISETFYFRVIPSTWSVAVELVCYFLVWLVGALSIKGAIALTTFGALWHVYVFVAGGLPTLRYGPVPAAALSFGLGCLAYFISTRFSLAKDVPLSVILSGVAFIFAINWWSSVSAPDIFSSIQFYFNTGLAFILVLLVNRRRFTGRSAKVDKFLGELAYPMFLGHYVFAFASLQILGLNEHRGWVVFCIGAVATIAASAVIVICIDYRIDGLRKSIKASAEKRRSLKAATA